MFLLRRPWIRSNDPANVVSNDSVWIEHYIYIRIEGEGVPVKGGAVPFFLVSTFSVCGAF